jgi:hypothetical protein
METEARSERYMLASRELDRLLERGVIDQDFQSEVLAQVELFEKRFSDARELPADTTILVMSGRFVQGASLNDVIELARAEGIEDRPYYCEQTPPKASGPDRSMGPGTPTVPTSPLSPLSGPQDENTSGFIAA